MKRKRYTEQEVYEKCQKMGLTAIDGVYPTKYREEIQLIDADGFKYSPKVGQILDNRQSRVNRCHKSNKFTFYNIQHYLDINNTGAILIIKDMEYVDNKTELKLKCKCGKVFTTYWNHILNANKTQCEVCGEELRHDNKRLSKHALLSKMKEANIETKINFDEVDFKKFSAKKTKLKCECINCGNTYYTTWNNLFYQKKYRCDSCAKKESKLEIEVESYLHLIEVQYQRQKKFINCKNVYSLPFDFYLPDYNCVIEVHGRQHYYEVPYFKSSLSYRKERDLFKKNYCLKNDISYLELPYYNIANGKYKFSINNILGIN